MSDENTNFSNPDVQPVDSEPQTATTPADTATEPPADTTTAPPGNDYRKPGLSRNARRTRQIKRLREENEKLHRRLAAIYDALTLQ